MFDIGMTDHIIFQTNLCATQKGVSRVYKIWVRADTHSFVGDFQVFTGELADTTKLRLGEQVVMDLTKELQGKNYHIYFNNFFSSLNPMKKKMNNNKLYCFSTIHANHKGLPKLNSKKELRRGDLDCTVMSNEIFCVHWMDKRSTKVGRMEKDGSVTQISCPNVVVEHNRFMGCVDMANMFKSLYAIDGKSRKWWHHLLWHFINITKVNAVVLFKFSTIPDVNNMMLKVSIYRNVTGLGESYSCKAERVCKVTLFMSSTKNCFGSFH
ncbi:hypothetical protein QYM36_018724 [Artemia franciscana]|uniref:PiggyBac transposable element-derived protein domain-containing protein n=1 Tax=Artemia franciscana TaxID=6661 RepID=A0AA88HBV4_ARTSF|nr:hypothetical protein QYM36_018724 [Artemia franciscana]